VREARERPGRRRPRRKEAQVIITRTPYRVSFFGGGSDYPVWYEQERGAVLSTTIDKYCYITCRYLPPFFPHRSRIVYSKVEIVKDVEEIEHASVRNALLFLGMHDGVEIHHDGDVPARSGLGTSSTFTVGLLHALHRLRGDHTARMQLAQEAVHVERNLNREAVGAQDQVAAALGGLNQIEFGPGEKIAATRIHVAPERLDELADHLMLFFTGVSRNATDIAQEQIRNTRKCAVELRELVSFVDEGAAILAGTRPLVEFGRLLHRSWLLKQRLSAAITTDVVDRIYARALEEGAVGGKLLGAGGGGFLLLFAPPHAQPRLREALADLVHIRFRFEDAGSQVIFEQSGAR
jgi:D-glycero-alpha-D-manno-heptose-7-phosphate kinase